MSDNNQNAEPSGGLAMNSFSGHSQRGQSPNNNRRGLGQRLGLRGRKAASEAVVPADAAVANGQDINNNENYVNGAVAAAAAFAPPPRPPSTGVGGAPTGKGVRRTVAATPGAVSVSNTQATEDHSPRRTITAPAPAATGVGGAPQGKMRRTTTSPVPSLPGAVSVVEPIGLSNGGHNASVGVGGAPQGKTGRSTVAVASRPGAVSVVEPTVASEPGAATAMPSNSGHSSGAQGEMRRTAAADLATGGSTHSLQPAALTARQPVNRSLSFDGAGRGPPKPAPSNGGDEDAQAMRRQQIQEIMRNPNLTMREKQLKTQELMASGMPKAAPSAGEAAGATGNGEAVVVQPRRIRRTISPPPQPARAAATAVQVAVEPAVQPGAVAGVGGAPQGKMRRSVVASRPGAVSVLQSSERSLMSEPGLMGVGSTRSIASTGGAVEPPAAAAASESETTAMQPGAVSTVGGAPQGKIRRTTTPSRPGAVSTIEQSLVPEPGLGSSARSVVSTGGVVEPGVQPGAVSSFGGAPQGKMRRTTAASQPGAVSSVEQSLVSEPGLASSSRSLGFGALVEAPESAPRFAPLQPIAARKALPVDEGDSDAQIMRRQQIQQIMRNPNLSPREKQIQTQQLMAGGMPEAPPASAPEAEGKQQIVTVSDSSQTKDDGGDGDAQVLRRKQVQEIMRDPNLSPREKQIRTQQLMSGGMPSSATKPPDAEPAPASLMRRTQTSPSPPPPHSRPAPGMLKDDSGVAASEAPRHANRSRSPAVGRGLRRVVTDRPAPGSDLGSTLEEPGAVSVVGGAPTGKLRRTATAASVPGAVSVVEPSSSSPEPSPSHGTGFRSSSHGLASGSSVGGAPQGKAKRATAAVRPGAVSVAGSNDEAVEPGAKSRVGDADVMVAVSTVESDLAAKARASRGRSTLVPGALSVSELVTSAPEPTVLKSSVSVGGAPQAKARHTTSAVRPGAVSVVAANDDTVEPGLAARASDADAIAAVSSVESDLMAKARASRGRSALVPGALSVSELGSSAPEPTVLKSSVSVGGTSQGKARRTTAAVRPGAVSVAASNDEAVEPGAEARVSDADAMVAVSTVESDLMAKARASRGRSALVPGVLSVSELGSSAPEPTVLKSSVSVGGAPQGKARRTTAAVRPGAVSVAASNDDAAEPGAEARVSDADAMVAVSTVESDLMAKARASRGRSTLVPGALSVSELGSSAPEPTVLKSSVSVGGAPQGKARRTTAAVRPGAVSVAAANDDVVEPGAAARVSGPDAMATVSSVESDLMAKARASRGRSTLVPGGLSVTELGSFAPEPTVLKSSISVGGAPQGKASRTTVAVRPGAVSVAASSEEAVEPGAADAMVAVSTVESDLTAKAKARRPQSQSITVASSAIPGPPVDLMRAITVGGAPIGKGAAAIASDPDAMAAVNSVESDLAAKARASRRGRAAPAVPGVQSVAHSEPVRNVEHDAVAMRPSVSPTQPSIDDGVRTAIESVEDDDASAAYATVEQDLQAKAKARQSRGLRGASVVPGASSEISRTPGGPAYNSDDPAHDDYSLAASTVERDLQAKSRLRTSGTAEPGFQSVEDSRTHNMPVVGDENDSHASNRVSRMEAKIRQMEMEQESRDAKLHEIQTLDARNAQTQAQSRHQPQQPKLITSPPLIIPELPPDDEPEEIDRAALFNPDPEAIRRAEQEGLAIAMAVDEDEEPDVYDVDVKVYDPESKPPVWKNRRFRCYAVLICIVTLAVIIATVAIASQKSAASTIFITEPPSASPSMPPTSTRETAVRSELARVLGDVVNEKNTPYEAAMNFILYDDALELDEFADNLVQRYVLALFYFKTTEQGNVWKSCNPPVDGENATCPFYEFTREEDNSISYYKKEETEIRWLSDRMECEWAQIICYQNKVAAIDMGGQNMTGTLPEELSNLDYLIWLTLSFNQFTGTIPASYGQLSYITYFEVTENLLTGQIPDGFFHAPKLLQFNPAYNEFSGTLPTEIGLMTTLQHVFMQHINLEGTVPTEIGGATDLRQLWIFENKLTGPLPSELGSLQMLSKLTFGGNHISGALPSELGQLTVLEEFLMPANSFTGVTIPESFWGMTNLLWLDISDNNFAGTVSTRIGQLTNLMGIKMRNNKLTGTIPSEIGLLRHLLLIWVHNTDLTGSVPTEVCYFQNISFINADCAGSPPQIQCVCCTGCCDEYGTCQKLS